MRNCVQSPNIETMTKHCPEHRLSRPSLYQAHTACKQHEVQDEAELLGSESLGGGTMTIALVYHIDRTGLRYSLLSTGEL